MLWNVSVEVRVDMNFDDIEADSEEEAKDIAEQRALESVDCFVNCTYDANAYLAYTNDGDDEDDE